MYVSTDEQKWKNRFIQWAKEYPDQVEIKRKAEDNDGCLYLTCPASWLRIRPPIKRNMTEEQKAASAERMRGIHKKRTEEIGEEPEDEE